MAEGQVLVSTDSRGHDRDQLLSEVYAARYRGMVGLAALLLRDAAAAEDIVQEAFVRIYTAWPRLRDPDKVDAYLRQTIVNLCRSRLRRLAVARRHHSPGDPDAASAEELAYAGFERDAVVTAVRALPQRQREAVVLRFWAGLTQDEAAEAMGVSAGSVKSYLSRGLDALERELGGVL